jgi:hypothetical protein
MHVGLGMKFVRPLIITQFRLEHSKMVLCKCKGMVLCILGVDLNSLLCINEEFFGLFELIADHAIPPRCRDASSTSGLYCR